MENVTIKKTMVAPLEFVKEHGRMSAENLEKFINEFCVPKTDSGSGKPREVVKLFDAEGNVIGRRCSVTHKWLPISEFFKDASFSKAADKVKAKLYAESKKMEKDAQKLLDQARDEADPMKKLELFEEYDDAMVKAREYRNQDVSDQVDFGDTTTYDTIEELANALNVPVITTKPKEEEGEDIA